MDLFIYSPSVMDATIPGQKAIPVFGDNDQVGGKVILDPTCSHSGRLSVSVRLLPNLFHRSNYDVTRLKAHSSTVHQRTMTTTMHKTPIPSRLRKNTSFFPRRR